MSWTIALVCEAPADHATATALATRAACETCALDPALDWVQPEYLTYRGFRPDTTHLLWRDVKTVALENGVSVIGFLNGLQASPDAHNAKRALALFDRLDARPDAVLLVRDSDGDLERRTGLEQARAAEPWPFAVLIGLAHTKRECWHICGFEPEEPDSEAERERLTAARSEVGLNLKTDTEQLTAKHDTDKKSAKRVLELLTGGSWDREQRCLTHLPLSALRERGEHNGLRAFLEEVRARLVPLFVK